MKFYKKVKLEAVNAPSGSYAAGCPTNETGWSSNNFFLCFDTDNCKKCERNH